ncbi:MAG: hypothetical protein DMF63_06635 [Acidobacteria bacterium]|nr:MAG: hypothetical protein DMF63_06635 [Acidobacteriota bacterium]
MGIGLHLLFLQVRRRNNLTNRIGSFSLSTATRACVAARNFNLRSRILTIETSKTFQILKFPILNSDRISKIPFKFRSNLENPFQISNIEIQILSSDRISKIPFKFRSNLENPFQISNFKSEI